jgi:hypothetical protein
MSAERYTKKELPMAAVELMALVNGARDTRNDSIDNNSCFFS